MICTTCKCDKPATKEFFALRSDTGKFRRQCRVCRQSVASDYKNRNIDRTREIAVNGYYRNRDTILKRLSNRRKTDEYRKKSREYEKNRRKVDMNFRIKKNLRGRIRDVVKDIRKSASTMELVGCSIDFLKIYLSEQFTEGMTWDNYGDWHIDHIRPCASFDLTDKNQQKECFHYTNLQPLWAEDNISKSDKW